MNHRSKLLWAATGILAGSALIDAAAADPHRVPEAGSPALLADSPPGWSAQYVRKDELTLSSADDLAVVEISVISDPVLAAKPLPEVARQVLISADLSPKWNSTEPDSIAGVQGQAFIEPIARDGVPVGLARLVVARIDAGHIARLTEITLIKVTTPEEEAALKTIISRLRIAGG